MHNECVFIRAVLIIDPHTDAIDIGRIQGAPPAQTVAADHTVRVGTAFAAHFKHAVVGLHTCAAHVGRAGSGGIAVDGVPRNTSGLHGEFAGDTALYCAPAHQHARARRGIVVTDLAASHGELGALVPVSYTHLHTPRTGDWSGAAGQ